LVQKRNFLGQKLSGFDLRPIWGPDKSQYN
jgi:hypothetical protein